MWTLLRALRTPRTNTQSTFLYGLGHVNTSSNSKAEGALLVGTGAALMAYHIKGNAPKLQEVSSPGNASKLQELPAHEKTESLEYVSPKLK
jgi:hypothetical protein